MKGLVLNCDTIVQLQFVHTCKQTVIHITSLLQSCINACLLQSMSICGIIAYVCSCIAGSASVSSVRLEWTHLPHCCLEGEMVTQGRCYIYYLRVFTHRQCIN